MEVYIDDMLVKTQVEEELLSNLETVFRCLWRHKIRLNLQKYVFAVEGGKFFGFILTYRGIEANPDKCKAILEMKSPTSVKDVQCLIWRIASLSRFLAASAWKTSPFFTLLKKESNFEWTLECKAVFQEFKSYLLSPPILYKPEVGSPLVLYLSVSNSAIAGILIREDAKQQFLVYFISKNLQGAKIRYLKLEKVALALVFPARCLWQYFQAHTIVVRTNQPIQQVLQKPNLAKRMVTWSIELSEFDIWYEPRTVIKA